MKKITATASRKHVRFLLCFYAHPFLAKVLYIGKRQVQKRTKAFLSGKSFWTLTFKNTICMPYKHQFLSISLAVRGFLSRCITQFSFGRLHGQGLSLACKTWKKKIPCSCKDSSAGCDHWKWRHWGQWFQCLKFSVLHLLALAHALGLRVARLHRRKQKVAFSVLIWFWWAGPHRRTNKSHLRGHGVKEHCSYWRLRDIAITYVPTRGAQTVQDGEIKTASQMRSSLMSTIKPTLNSSHACNKT